MQRTSRVASLQKGRIMTSTSMFDSIKFSSCRRFHVGYVHYSMLPDRALAYSSRMITKTPHLVRSQNGIWPFNSDVYSGYSISQITFSPKCSFKIFSKCNDVSLCVILCTAVSIFNPILRMRTRNWHDRKGGCV